MITTTAAPDRHRIRAALVLVLVAVLGVAQFGHPPKSSAAVPRNPQPPAAPPATSVSVNTAATAAATDSSTTISRALFTFLTTGLGLNLGSSPTLTGTTTGHAVTLTVGPLKHVLPGLPQNVAWGPTTVVVDTAANTATVTSTATGAVGATARVVVAHASTTTLAAADVTGAVTLADPLFGVTAHLAGPLTVVAGAPSVTLTGTLPSAATVGGLTLAAADVLRFTTIGGLVLSGPASFGSAGFTVSGRITAPTTWTLTAGPGTGTWTPLSGLRQTAAFTGTVTNTSGTVAVDLHDPATTTWTPETGLPVAVSGTEYATTTPPAGAPVTLTAGGTWLKVTGAAAIPAGRAGTLATAVTVLADPAHGRASLTATQSAPLTLDAHPNTVLTAATLRGDLTVGGTITGPISGTGRVTTDSPAQAAVTLTTSGAVTVAFATDLSGYGLGPAGDFGTATWTSTTDAITAPAGPSPTPTPSPTPSTSPSPTPSPTPPPTGGHSFTVSPAVALLLAALGTSLHSATLSGTLSGTTLTITGGPATLPVTLPSGATPIALGPLTVAVDLSTGTLTATASATTTASGIGGQLTVTVAHAATSALSSTDLTAALHLSGLSVLGASVDVDGSITYSGGAVSVRVMGSLPADVVVRPGLLTLQAGTMVSLSTADGAQVNGTVVLGTAPSAFTVAVSGSVHDARNWTLMISDAAGAPSFTPIAGLTLTPTFTGTISDTAGSIGFDVSADDVLTWSPSATVSLALHHVEISNQIAPATTCPAGLADGQVWVDVAGTLTAPAAGITATAEACIAPQSRTFAITGTEAGNVLPGSAGFSLTNLTVAVAGDLKAKTFTISGHGTVTITAIAAQPTFTVGISVSSGGTLVAGVRVGDPSTLGVPGVNGDLYVASKPVKQFDPAVLGITGGQPFDLPAGVTVTAGYTLPADAITALTRIGVPIGTSGQFQLDATLGPAGFTATIQLGFGAGTNGAKIFSTPTGAAAYLNSLSLGVSVGENTSFTASGSARLVLPPLYGDAGSQVQVTVSGSLTLEPLKLSLSVDLAGACGTASCPWQDAFGIPGLTVDEVSGSVGIDFTTEIPTPTLFLAVSNLVLPDAWASAIGMTPGSQVSLAVNLDAAQPELIVSINGTSTNPVALTPLRVASADPAIYNQLQVNTAQLILAPLGGKDATGQPIPPGVALVFDGAIAGVAVHVDGAIGIAPPSLTATVSVGGFSVGPVTLQNTMLHIAATTSGLDISVSGGFYDASSGISFAASFDLGASTSLASAGVSLHVAGGQPAYLQLAADLHGSVTVDPNYGISFSAAGAAELIIGGTDFGSVYFAFASNSGALWQELTQDATQVAAAFHTAYGWLDSTAVSVLEQFRFGATQTAAAIAGAYQESVAQVVSAFTQAGAGIDDAIQTVSAGLNATTTQIAGALTQLGYSVQTTAALLADDLGAGQAAIYNAFQSLGQGGQTVLNQISSFFNNGSYTIATTAPFGLPELMDVSGGSTDPDAPVIQYHWDGGANQDWYVLPTDSGYAELVNRNSGQCLTTYGSDTAAGQNLVQYPCQGLPSQQWYLGVYPGNTDVSYQTHTLQNRGSQLYADVTGASRWDNASIDQWTYNGDWNQQWNFVPAIG